LARFRQEAIFSLEGVRSHEYPKARGRLGRNLFAKPFFPCLSARLPSRLHRLRKNSF
jgi:hypothetical protein